MGKEPVYFLNNAPPQTGANNNTAKEIREIDSWFADFVEKMKTDFDRPLHDQQILFSLFREIERIALESDNIDLLISKMRLSIKYWEYYKNIYHDEK